MPSPPRTTDATATAATAGATAAGLTYGNHMAISMALGFLFLGAGRRTFSTSNPAIAALLIALFPKFPATTSDQRCHLQVGKSCGAACLGHFVVRQQCPQYL